MDLSPAQRAAALLVAAQDLNNALQLVQEMRDTLRLVHEALTTPGDPRLVLPEVEAALAAAEGGS